MVCGMDYWHHMRTAPAGVARQTTTNKGRQIGVRSLVLMLLFVVFSFKPGMAQSTAVGSPAQMPSGKAVVYVEQFVGSDIGAQVNAAIQALSLMPAAYSGEKGEHCGTVALTPGRYLQQTTILKPNCVWIEGNEAQLVYQGHSYSIIEAGPVLQNETFSGAVGGVRNLWLNGGANIRKGPDETSGYAGLMVGGDPSGATPGNFGAFAQTNADLHIEGFQNGVILGRFSSLTTFQGGSINGNGTGVWFPGNAFGSGEAYSFYGTQLNNNHEQGVRDDDCGQIRMHGGSIDYTGGVPGQPFYRGNRFAVNGSCVDFQAYGTHFEQDGAPLLHVTGGRVTLFGGEVYASAEKGTSPAYVLTEGKDGKFASFGTAYYARHNVVTRMQHTGESSDAAADIDVPDHVSWSSREGAPSAASACANGSLYSNTTGGEKSTLWVCVMNHWKATQ